MNKLYASIIFFLSIAFVTLGIVEGFAQGTWVQKASLPGFARGEAFHFSIGNKGYIGGGQNSSSICYQDFWEWDQPTNTWTQKANFGGGRRAEAVSFTIANKGYVTTGWNPVDPNLFQNDIWVYDPSANMWTQKISMPSTIRVGASGFSIGYKGYVGLGSGGINPNFVYFSDLWEYNSLTDIWTQKANFPPGYREQASGFSIGNKGYFTCGVDSFTNLNDLWEWDQLTNTWTQKANLPALPRATGIAFSIGGFG